MPQLPLTHYPINPNVVSGSFLAQILNDTEQAVFSAQSGPAAPPVALAGTFWLDTAIANSYVLKFYTGQVWLILTTFDPATGSGSVGGQSVLSVNTRQGNVRVREIYDSTETTLMLQSTNDGIDLIINPDPAPQTNLLATQGRLAFDTTKNNFVGYNGTAWTLLGGGGYTQFANELIADLGSISNSNLIALQFRPITSATDITIGNIPFSIPAPLWTGGTVIAIENAGTFKITFVDSNASASGLITADPIELDPGKTAQFIFDSLRNRWLPSGGAGGGAGKFIPYPVQTVIAAGSITALPDKFFQWRPINSGANVTLSLTPFGDATLFGDALVLNILNNGANNIVFPDGVATQFGLYNNGIPFTLYPGTLASFQYDKVGERFYLVGTSASSGGGGGGGSAVNDQTVIAAGQINLLPVGYQSIILTAAAPITLADAAFITPIGFPDRGRVLLQGSSDINTVTLNYADVAGGSILFGLGTLGNYYKLELEYQATANRWIEITRNT